MVSLYFVYRNNKNAYRTDITNDDKNAYVFTPTYGDGYTVFHRHMISAVLFFYLNKHKIMLVDYTVTETGCFDDYLDAAPHAKKMRGNGITNFILHVAQCITFNQTKCFTSTLIDKALLK